MGVFDGGAYRVNVYRYSDEDPEVPETMNVDEASDLVKILKDDPDIKAVEVFNLHYMIGDYRGDLSFGDPYEEDE